MGAWENPSSMQSPISLGMTKKKKNKRETHIRTENDACAADRDTKQEYDLIENARSPCIHQSSGTGSV